MKQFVNAVQNSGVLAICAIDTSITSTARTHEVPHSIPKAVRKTGCMQASNPEIETTTTYIDSSHLKNK